VRAINILLGGGDGDGNGNTLGGIAGAQADPQST
jgi:hypothetical protein